MYKNDVMYIKRLYKITCKIYKSIKRFLEFNSP